MINITSWDDGRKFEVQEVAVMLCIDAEGKKIRDFFVEFSQYSFIEKSTFHCVVLKFVRETFLPNYVQPMNSFNCMTFIFNVSTIVYNVYLGTSEMKHPMQCLKFCLQS